MSRKLNRTITVLICVVFLLGGCKSKVAKATNDELKQVVISLCDELEVAEGR
ncbi:hypothetical protein AGMMS49975_28350 [Clostridia bacterium]|nr:hypothetical protein AGMMS49975_28350 [Clostridia bacterium]